jgi:ABC-type glycerol-3-phosphate transport system substrate-binding protein
MGVIGQSKRISRRHLLGAARTAAGAGLLAVTPAWLAACGTSPQSSAPASATKGHPAVTLEYWSRWPAADTTAVEEKRITEFNTANAPTKVVRTPMVGDYIEKLNTAFAAGTGPDTYTVGGSGIPNFSAKGAALTLDKYPAVIKEAPDFFPAALEACKYQGKLNGLPYIIDIRAMIARKDLMQQAGLDPAKFPDTWDQFREAARRMTKRNGQDFQVVGFSVPKSAWSGHDFFITLIEQQGEHAFSADLTKPTFNSAAGREALQMMVDMINKDQVDTFSPPAPPAKTDPLVAGLQASAYNSAGPVNAARNGARDVLAQIMTAPIPKLKQRVTYMGGTELMASNAPKDATAAVDFLLYLTSAKFADEITSVQNSVPPRKSANTSDYVKDPLIKTFYDAVAYAWSYPNHPYYTDIRDVIQAGVEAAIKQQKGVQAALDDAARGVQDLLTRK